MLCIDGSYPLHWTQLHELYKELFDQQLEAILWFQDSHRAALSRSQKVDV